MAGEKNLLTLLANPTFPGEVEIDTPEGQRKLAFTFKHVPKSKLQAFIESMKDKSDSETVMAVASAWGLPDEFDAENIEQLCDQYHAAGRLIFTAWLTQLAQFKKGN